jgi:1-deoxy-D-xylulose-5-phosphate synthase
MSILETIDSPEDLKRLPASRLPELAADLRRTIIQTCAANGGHLAPSLGVVELTIALHRVFTTPSD